MGLVYVHGIVKWSGKAVEVDFLVDSSYIYCLGEKCMEVSWVKA